MLDQIPNRRSLWIGVVVTLAITADMVVRVGYDIQGVFFVLLGIPVAVVFLMLANPEDKKELNLSIVIGMPFCALLWPVLLLGLLVGRPWKDKKWTNRRLPSCEHDDNWQAWSNDRKAAIEKILGPADTVLHSVAPRLVGWQPDVLQFRRSNKGVTFVTAGLVGSDQPETSLGQYELMICQRDDKEQWATKLISQLAVYTLSTPLQPWDTMSIARSLPNGANLCDALFVPYAEFEVRNKKCGLLLCLGLTNEESHYCKDVDCEPVIDRLKEAGEYPFTTPRRKSVIKVE